jgi:hypothetical protein
MSANRPVGRSAATPKNDRSAATHKNNHSAAAHNDDRSTVTAKRVRSTATPEAHRTAAAPKGGRSTVAHNNDRASLCSFTFADGRQCRTPRCSDHPHLCYFHARKEAQTLAAQEIGRDISACLSGSYLSGCDLSFALGRLFSAVAQGRIKPKTASTLAYLGQTILQSIHIAQLEYIDAFGTNSWRAAVRSSFVPPEPDRPASAPEPEPQPVPPSDSPTSSGAPSQ